MTQETIGKIKQLTELLVNAKAEKRPAIRKKIATLLKKNKVDVANDDNLFAIRSPWGGEVYLVRFRYAVYQSGAALYLGLDNLDGLDTEDEDASVCWVPYGDVTTFIASDCKRIRICVDTNNMPQAEQLLEESELAYFWSKYAYSGYCAYPVYLIDTEVFFKLLMPNATEEEKAQLTKKVFEPET